MEFKIEVSELQSILAKLAIVSKPSDEDMGSMIVVEGNDAGLSFKSAVGRLTLIISAEKFEMISKGIFLFRLTDLKAYAQKFVSFVGDYGTKDFHFIEGDSDCLVKSVTYFPSEKPSYRKLKLPIFHLDFPAIKPFDDPLLIINSSILKKGLNRVLHCINPGEVRRAMTGANITIMTDKIIFAGTNGVKLAEFSLPINADIDNKSYLFTYGLAAAMRSVLDDDAQVFMKFEGDRAFIRSNNIYLIGPILLGEKFPDYKALFKLEKTIKVPRLDFYDSIHTVMDVLDPEDNHRLSITFSGNDMLLKNDKSECKQTFDNSFDTLDIDVNGLFLDALLTNILGDNLEIYFKEGNNYIVFKSIENPDHTALITTVKRR
jgi:DNA polymerase III sliding clamp (beta) subunit (PCNA family)